MLPLCTGHLTRVAHSVSRSVLQAPSVRPSAAPVACVAAVAPTAGTTVQAPVAVAQTEALPLVYERARGDAVRHAELRNMLFTEASRAARVVRGAKRGVVLARA